MKNNVTLPPINIRARAPNSSLGGSIQFGDRTLTPALMRAMDAHYRLETYLKGDWQQTVNGLLAAQRNDPQLTGLLKKELTAAYYADQFMCRNPQASGKQAWSQGMSTAKSRDDNIDTSENELSGGVFSPIKALAHAISGEGTPLQVKIENTGIKPTPINVPALQALIDKSPIGSSPISIDRVSYNTGIDSKITEAYLGHISLRITGQIHKHNEQHYSFTGEARAYHDFYDANASTHRSWLAETSTAVLDKIMQGDKAKGYEIAITGSLPINHSQ